MTIVFSYSGISRYRIILLVIAFLKLTSFSSLLTLIVSDLTAKLVEFFASIVTIIQYIVGLHLCLLTFCIGYVIHLSSYTKRDWSAQCSQRRCLISKRMRMIHPGISSMKFSRKASSG